MICCGCGNTNFEGTKVYPKFLICQNCGKTITIEDNESNVTLKFIAFKTCFGTTITKRTDSILEIREPKETAECTIAYINESTEDTISRQTATEIKKVLLKL